MGFENLQRFVNLALGVVALASLIGWPMLVMRLRKEFALKEQIVSKEQIENIVEKDVAEARRELQTSIGTMGTTTLMQHNDLISRMDRIAVDVEKAVTRAEAARDLSMEARMIAESCQRDRETFKELFSGIADALAKKGRDDFAAPDDIPAQDLPGRLALEIGLPLVADVRAAVRRAATDRASGKR